MTPNPNIAKCGGIGVFEWEGTNRTADVVCPGCPDCRPSQPVGEKVLCDHGYDFDSLRTEAVICTPACHFEAEAHIPSTAKRAHTAHLEARVADVERYYSESQMREIALRERVAKLEGVLKATETHLAAYIDAIESGGGAASKSSELLAKVRAALKDA